MKKLIPILSLGLLLIGACGKSTGNPLLEATDGQFIRAMDFSASDCEEVLFDPSKVRYPGPHDRENCAEKIKGNAALSGIPKLITLKDVEDPHVKERYFKLKK